MVQSANPTQDTGASTASTHEENQFNQTAQYSQCIYSNLNQRGIDEDTRIALALAARRLKLTPSPNSAAEKAYHCAPVTFASHTSLRTICRTEYVQKFTKDWLAAIAACSAFKTESS